MSVADQGVFAVANFTVSILLARWLSSEDYGAFTVVYTTLLFVAVIHSAFLIEPMLVFGPGRFDKRLVAYLGWVVKGHAGFSGFILAVGAIAAATFWLSGDYKMARSLAVLAVAAPLILFGWLTRRAAYARLIPDIAFRGALLYFAVLLAGVAVARYLGLLDGDTGIGLMAVAGLAMAVYLMRALAIDWRGPTDGDLAQDARRAHLEYGRWSLGSSLLSWFPANIYFLLLPVAGGLSDTAALRALMNLILPVQHVLTALSFLLLPALARARGDDRFAAVLRRALIGFVALAVLYAALVIPLRGPIVDLLYGGRYAEHAHLVWWLAAIPVAGALVDVLGAALRALERPKLVFAAYVATAAIAALLGLPLMFEYGVLGAVIALLATSLVTGAAMAWLLIGRRIGTNATLLKAPITQNPQE